ncbi:hypothetical protein E2562_027540 [Oryza meyeriana var. granulata]|uniref:Uncharacterized protein n=1 Tax=Oryza meyeriana var. granulata TaxID=110450 RepID=A0A6G1CJC2_9ORYZ|nr:hypothetical protein E2562_027540 [Oryza meyeriana var. granulata]
MVSMEGQATRISNAHDMIANRTSIEPPQIPAPPLLPVADRRSSAPPPPLVPSTALLPVADPQHPLSPRAIPSAHRCCVRSLHCTGQRATANTSDRTAQSKANKKRLINFSMCEVYGKTINNFLPTDHPPSPRGPSASAVEAILVVPRIYQRHGGVEPISMVRDRARVQGEQATVFSLPIAV